MLIREKITLPVAASEATEPRSKPIARKEPAKDEPRTVACRGLKLCPNAHFLYAVVDERKVTVRAGRWSPRLVGKDFQATATVTGDETTYAYTP